MQPEVVLVDDCASQCRYFAVQSKYHKLVYFEEASKAALAAEVFPHWCNKAVHWRAGQGERQAIRYHKKDEDQLVADGEPLCMSIGKKAQRIL